jgi:hypothetical protein
MLIFTQSLVSHSIQSYLNVSMHHSILQIFPYLFYGHLGEDMIQ